MGTPVTVVVAAEGDKGQGNALNGSEIGRTYDRHYEPGLGDVL
jgi:hypothetical protein